MAWFGSQPKTRFQSLGRDSGRSDVRPDYRREGKMMFQSLGRDSGRSDGWKDAESLPPAVFQSLGRDSGRSDKHDSTFIRRRPDVSIARARFGSL